MTNDEIESKTTSRDDQVDAMVIDCHCHFEERILPGKNGLAGLCVLG